MNCDEVNSEEMDSIEDRSDVEMNSNEVNSTEANSIEMDTTEANSIEMVLTEDQSATKMNPTEDRSASDMNRIQATMDDLPEEPFKRILSYLSLEDLIKSRAVSRKWRQMINSFEVESLCCSDRPSAVIYKKKRWISGAFAQNFIWSPRFESISRFFSTFDESILSGLMHLRLLNLSISAVCLKTLAQTLTRCFKLDLIDVTLYADRPNPRIGIKLYMFVLSSICVQNLKGIGRLILEAPMLKEVEFMFSDIQLYTSQLSLELVYAESVEKLITNAMRRTQAKSLKSLKYLYTTEIIDSTFLLLFLDKLKEIHLKHSRNLPVLFDQKQRYGRVDLKIYLCGLLLNGADDPAIRSLSSFFDESTFRCLAENPSRLADEIRFVNNLDYSAIEPVDYKTIDGVAANWETSVLSKFIDLQEFSQYRPIRDTQRFLNILKILHQVSGLSLSDYSGQPQDLLDRLPEYSTVQGLSVYGPVQDFGFLSRFESLINIYIPKCDGPIDLQLIRTVLQLPFVSYFIFEYMDTRIRIEVHYPDATQTRYKVSIEWSDPMTVLPDLNATIQFINEKTQGEFKLI